MFRATKRLKSFSSDNNPPVVPPADSNAKSLPDADALLHASSFLNNKDFARTKQALGHLLYPKGLFHNTRVFHKISAAGKLLKATEYADYDQVEKLIADKNKLGLMFEPVSFTFRDGSEGRISPLRYAFKVHDAYMWKTVFLRRIEEIKDPKKREEGLKKFFAQMKEQEKAGHIDLEPLFQAYEEYEGQFQRWQQDQILVRDLDHEWHKLGKKQKELLPVHILKEFLCEGNRWRADASFDVNCMPRPSHYRAYSYIINAYQSLSSILSDPGWGAPFLLIRGPWETARASNTGMGVLLSLLMNVNVQADMTTFRRLFKVRSEDFTNQLSLMSQNTLKRQEQENQEISAHHCCKS